MTQATDATSADLLMAVEPENVTAGTAGFLIIAALAVGTVFLLRSLNKQLKKVDFEETDDSADEAPDDSADGSTDAGAPVSDEPEEGPRSPQG
jgi:hypothetical protein